MATGRVATLGRMLVRDELDQSPDDLAARLGAGSQEALAEAYRRWSTLVYNMALRALGDHHDAEDVTQQVFVSAWRGRHTLRPGSHALPGWLVGIARHRIADLKTQRYRSLRNTAAVAVFAGQEMTDAPHDDLPVRLLLAHQLDQLGEPRATVVRMAIIEDRPQDEIAAHLSLPIGTVKSHVRRGLLHLRAQMVEVNSVAP
jgi:RNA polymerase sigma factor (sigma-70 family)